MSTGRTLQSMTTPTNTSAPTAAPVDPQTKMLEHLASIRTGVNTIATILVLGVIAGIAIAASSLF